jgi:ribosomal 50S subunit-recycling heat shock protein
MDKILVTIENEGVRLDVFLAKYFFSITRGEIIRNIKKGGILVNDKVVKPSYHLKESDSF